MNYLIHMDHKVDKTQIRNILSIRYNPHDKTQFFRASPSNFKNKYQDDDGLKTQELLKQSILKKIPDDGETITISLSSGIDSSLLLGLLRKTFPKRKIVSICGIFENGFNESKRAKLIAQKFDSDFITVEMDSIFVNMPELINMTKKPRWNSFHHIIAKEAKKHGKYFVTGDGADEIFGGYTFRYNTFLNFLTKNHTWKSRVKFYLDCHNRDWVQDQEKIFSSKINFNWNTIHNYFKPYFQNSLSPLQQVMLADFNGKLLFDFIPTSKSISKYYKLIGTPIFLDDELIKFGLQLPLEQKYSFETNTGKIPLRKIAKRLKIKHIEEKRGFSPSLLFDWQKNGRDIYKIFINENSYLVKQKLIDLNWVNSAFNIVENDGDIRYLNRLISIFAVEIWCRMFITKQIKNKIKLI